MTQKNGGGGGGPQRAAAGGRGGGGRGRGNKGRGGRGGGARNKKNEDRLGDENYKEEDSKTRPDDSNEKQQQQVQQQQKKKTNGQHRRRKGGGGKHINNKSGGGGGGGSQQQKQYPPHWDYDRCMRLYVQEKDPNIVRGKLRVLPAKDGMGFVACDRGSLKRDVMLAGPLERNRGMNGDIVFVQLLPPEEEEEGDDDELHTTNSTCNDHDNHQQNNNKIQQDFETLSLNEKQTKPANRVEDEKDENEMWQDDEVQMKLWNPAVPIRRIKTLAQGAAATAGSGEGMIQQRKGRVVHVCAPVVSKDATSTNSKQQQQQQPRRIMVGTLKTLPSGTCLFTPNDRTLPQFKCNSTVAQEQRKRIHEEEQQQKEEGNSNAHSRASGSSSSDLYKAEYIYHSWQSNHNWPPCVNVQRLGDAISIEDQIKGLLMENQVDHGEFTPQVLQDVDNAVQSGVYLMENNSNASTTDTKKKSSKTTPATTTELGWKPTIDMYKGRRDYRKERIFTIDPTTAKDLDDALHIKEMPDGSIELGVHIADVSAFVTPGTDVDKEALRRATTVYLVDRTVPMLPRPLCEVACSLNENVERLAFSCVWKMEKDGSLGNTKDVWYGRTVIKSCARLDYGTAQNIIDQKVANGKKESDMDEELWPSSRRPTGGHTIEEVAADVRLMHRVAMARRRLRFANGALALHGVKLTFQLDEDGETPLRCAPYPIKDSNRLVEEYMLLANYLVAQRLITHAGERAVLRRHPDPLPDGLQKVADISKLMFNFDVDASSSASLHASLVQLGSICNDETFLKCLTQMMTTPMQNADYFAAGAFERELWRHFALNIPYYTHFTSPIRRYADVLVHRLLQATIDGEEAVDQFPLEAPKLHEQCEHCNEKRLASKMAQERCDVIFLALYLRKHPMKSELGVVMSLGAKAFTVFVPALGVNAMVFLQEHEDWLDYESQGEEEPDRRIILRRKQGVQGGPTAAGRWSKLVVQMFTKVLVSCMYKDKPRVDVKLLLEGPAP